MIDIVEKFRAQANPQTAAAQAAYMRNQFEFIGLKTPERRELSKNFLSEKIRSNQIDWPMVWALWYLPERDFQYLACDYLVKMKKYLQFSDMEKIKKLAVTKSWWDTVDNLDELVGALLLPKKDKKGREITDENFSEQGQREKILTEIKNWASDENFWVRRLAIDCQLTFKEKTDTELLKFVIEQNLVGSQFADEFFINKAIGWALRDFSKSNPVWVKNFLHEHEEKMAKLSLREASKYLK